MDCSRLLTPPVDIPHRSGVKEEYSMRFEPANIANALRNRGIPIARGKQRHRQNGVHVFRAGGGIFFEWKVYPNLASDDRTEEVLTALESMGYTTMRVFVTYVYYIQERLS